MYYLWKAIRGSIAGNASFIPIHVTLGDGIIDNRASVVFACRTIG